MLNVRCTQFDHVLTTLFSTHCVSVKSCICINIQFFECNNDHPHKHIDEEEGEDDDKNDEIQRHVDLVVQYWPLALLLTVDPTLHDTMEKTSDGVSLKPMKHLMI